MAAVSRDTKRDGPAERAAAVVPPPAGRAFRFVVVTLLALRDRVLPPTTGFREADPECAIDCIAGEARATRAGLALSNSFAFGGLNAVLALRRA